MQLSEPLAEGRTARIHHWDEGRVVKLFRPDLGLGVAQAERQKMALAAAAGVSVPAPGEVVSVGERVGLVMAAVAGSSMMELILQQPDQLEAYARQLAELHAALHRISSSPALPSFADLLRAKIARAVRLTDTQRAAALRALAEMPVGQAFCHGDFHPGNLLMGAHGPVIIDWSDAAAGRPLADVARTSLLFSGHIALNAGNPATQAPMKRYHDTYVGHYLAAAGADRGEIRQWYPILCAARLAEGIDEQLDWLHEQVRDAFGE